MAVTATRIRQFNQAYDAIAELLPDKATYPVRIALEKLLNHFLHDTTWRNPCLILRDIRRDPTAAILLADRYQTRVSIKWDQLDWLNMMADLAELKASLTTGQSKLLVSQQPLNSSANYYLALILIFLCGVLTSGLVSLII